MNALRTLEKVELGIYDIPVEFHLVNDDFSICEDSILGTNFLHQSKARINYFDKPIEICGQEILFNPRKNNTEFNSVLLNSCLEKHLDFIYTMEESYGVDHVFVPSQPEGTGPIPIIDDPDLVDRITDDEDHGDSDHSNKTKRKKCLLHASHRGTQGSIRENDYPVNFDDEKLFERGSYCFQQRHEIEFEFPYA